MTVRERRDLRQMCYDEHLMYLCQPTEPTADLHRGTPSNPGVDLVEHQCGWAPRTSENDLDRQHHPRQLAAGGALVQRQGWRAGMRNQPDLHLVGAVGAHA